MLYLDINAIRVEKCGTKPSEARSMAGSGWLTMSNEICSIAGGMIKIGCSA